MARFGRNKIGSFMKNWRSTLPQRQRFRQRTRAGSGQGRGRSHTGAGITQQHDARSIYRKHRMPRRMKRRWKGFCRKVQAVSERDLGSRTVVYNKSQPFTNSTANNQGLGYLALYSANGTGDSFMADLHNIVMNDNTGVTNLRATGGFIYETSKFIFKSAVLDITLRNTSVVHTALGDTAAAEAKLEVDFYEIISRREWNDTSAVYSDITGCFTKGSLDTVDISGGAVAASSLELTDRGTTPWDLPSALSYFGIKILKKTKYFVENGGTMTYQCRDPKRRVSTQEKLEKTEGGNKPGWSRHILIIFKLVPGLTIHPTNVGSYTESITIGMTRKFFYKIEGQSEDRDMYLVN